MGAFVLGGIGVFLLLCAVLWPSAKKRIKKEVTWESVAANVRVLRKAADEYLRESVNQEEVVRDVKVLSKDRVRRVGVLTVDTTHAQVCGGCHSIWLGDPVRSGWCGKCGGSLMTFVAGGAPTHYVVVSEERLRHLLSNIDERAATVS